VCALTGWPIGHALLVSRDDPAQLVSSGVWRMTDERRYAAFREATENEPLPIPDSLAGAAVATGKPVLVSTADFRGDPARSMTVSVVSIETTAADDDDSRVVPLSGLRGSRATEWIALGLRAGMAVPILAGSNVVGVLEFFSGEPLASDPELLDLL